MPTADGKRLREKVLEGAETVEEDEMGQDEWEVVSFALRAACYINMEIIIQIMLIDPGQFRVINELLQKECKGRGRLETMTISAPTAAA
jgi:ribosome maturation protein SDO1